MEKMTKSLSNVSFEQALKELENITKRLEDGSMGLDESIIEFERGNEFVKFCQSKIEEAEKKIEILQKGESINKQKSKVIKKRVKIKKDTGEIDDNEDLQGSLL